ncbi:MAG: hypothetical protein ABSG66_11650 [Stellaceae bacterium]|jgi:hypothetical protein
MSCLYRSDYGPPDAAFNPQAGGGVLLQGFESHESELLRAQNRGQLDAMKRQLQHGQEILWCDQGYGWVYQKPVDYFFEIVLIAVILPWFVARLVLPALRGWHSRASATRLS